MTHNYQLTGMTCTGCEAKVKHNLLLLPGVSGAAVSKEKGTATISMLKHISLAELQTALGGKDSKYQISNEPQPQAVPVSGTTSWFATYKPILLIFGYVTLVAMITSWKEDHIVPGDFMRVFMAGFFLTFSFFKLLNISAFANSYAMYDIIAKNFKGWGSIYAFIELGLGIAFALNLNPVLTNWVTLIVMSVSIIGVLQSVLNKKQIQCACLGAVFNLPMSTVTIVEDALMIAMSGTMLLMI